MRVATKNGERRLRFSLKGHNFVIFKEKPGIISPNACWVCFCGPYMYDANTFLGLLWTIYTKWQADHNLIG